MKLCDNNWLAYNKHQLEKLIKATAHQNHYVVFDWDYTCIFYDAQDSLFLYQINNLLFRLNPTDFSEALRFAVPQTLLSGVRNLENRELTVGELADDVCNLYTFLYGEYQGLGGSRSLVEVSSLREALDFKVKLFALMHASYYVSDVDMAQRVATGFRLEEYESMAQASIDYALAQDIMEYELLSTNHGKAGACRVIIREGIRIQPEIQNLFAVLQAHGIAVYVCSASQKENVSVFAGLAKYGYHVQSKNVFGRKHFFDDTGRLTAKDDLHCGNTRAKGKVTTIRECIMPRHDNKAPILIAGDSDGDFYMMDAFKDSSMLLIFDRNPDSGQKIYDLYRSGIAQRGQDQATILVQPRDAGTGLCCAYADKER